MPLPRLVLALLIAGTARAEPPPEVVALETAIRKVIQAADGSVACVLVSRSDKYAAFGGRPPSGVPGELGDFKPINVRFGRGAHRELVRQLDLANPETVPEAYGSGVVIDDRGLILTNYHVIEGATKVYVRLKGPNRGSYANILAADGRADLAVLQMIAPPADLTAVRLGDGGKLRKGDFVVALANPFAAGFRNGDPTSTFGTIGNLRQRAPGPLDEVKRTKPLAQYGTLIQTDAALKIGSSGGALLNLNGELIGLTSSLAAVTGTDTPGGFAIPIDANAKKMIDVLKRGEEIEYGFLGVTVNPDARGTAHGVSILDVAPGMPAHRAGLQPQDFVVSIDGHPVREPDDLFLYIAAALAGSEVAIEARRPGAVANRTFKVRLAKSKHDEKTIVSRRPPAVFGLRVDYLSTLPTDGSLPEGVVIPKDDGLEPRTPAAEKLKEWADRASLIVTAVDGRPVSAPADFYRAAAGKASVTLDIVEARRDGPVRKSVKLP
jgi:serine protease Do